MSAEPNTDEVIEIPIDAARVCDAIARIGYSASAAIMDIVDNSVTWGADSVRIIIVLREGTTYYEKCNIDSVAIVDNGSGMDDDGIRNALRLGSADTYPPRSLSKFGMGLKSAGFSLGRRITVLSKKQGRMSRQFHVDKNEIAAARKYLVKAQSPEAQLSELIDDASGTVIRISVCCSTNHDSAGKTIQRLEDHLGVTYFPFLSRVLKPLQLSVECTGKPKIVIGAKDILFKTDAYEAFDKDTYDCKRPCKVLDVELPIDENSTVHPKLTVVLFPQDQLSRCPEFGAEERKRIKDYGVSRSNKGFFVYRNDRLIRWGDDLSGLVAKDDLLFRATLTITTDHDEILHVDVSKQRLFIPEEIRKKIEMLIRLPLRHCEDIKLLCKDLMKGDEGGEFNERNKDLPVESDEPVVGEKEREAVRERKKKLAESSERALQEAGEGSDSVSPVSQLPTFQRVRYSDKVASVFLWEMGEHPTDGVFVRINKNHSFYQTVISHFEENAPERQALEALIWCAAVGENSALTGLTDLTSEQVDRTLTKFKRTLAIILDSWSSRNQDLFDDGKI